MHATTRTVRSATLVSAILLICSLPVILVAWFHASAGVVLFGALTWALGQVVKGSAYAPSSRLLGDRLPPAEWAAVRGILSALSELCPSGIYLAFFLQAPSISNLIGFGVGASSAEVMFLLLMRRFAYRRRPHAELRTGTMWPGVVQYIFLAERFAALLLHVGSRCLVYISISQHNVWVGLWALVSFSLVDGVAAYGKLRGWNWVDPYVWRRFYGFVLAVSLSDVALFATMVQSLNH